MRLAGLDLTADWTGTRRARTRLGPPVIAGVARHY